MRAQRAETMTYRSIHSILTQGLDHAPPESIPAETRLPATHGNVRGATYYADVTTNANTVSQLALMTGDR